MSRPSIVVSVVSHRQGDLVRDLLADMVARVKADIRLVLTVNVPEQLPFGINDYGFPIEIIRNERPKGFAANQNQAFQLFSSKYFCAVNPDIRLIDDPFDRLVRCLEETGAALAVPVVTNEEGVVEDSVRPFPTPARILQKTLGFRRAGEYKTSACPLSPDWAAGMFMLFQSSVYQKLGGFDERFYLYYEDVDICARLRLSGRELVLCPDTKVVHAARRESHRNPAYLKWHFASMLRFFCSPVFAKLVSRGLLARGGMG